MLTLPLIYLGDLSVPQFLYLDLKDNNCSPHTHTFQYLDEECMKNVKCIVNQKVCKHRGINYTVVVFPFLIFCCM